MELKLKQLETGLANAKNELEKLNDTNISINELARMKKLIDTLQYNITNFDFIFKTTPSVIDTILVQLKMKKLL